MKSAPKHTAPTKDEEKMYMWKIKTNQASKQTNKLNERLYTNSLSYNAHTFLTIMLFEDKSLHLILLWCFDEKR